MELHLGLLSIAGARATKWATDDDGRRHMRPPRHPGNGLYADARATPPSSRARS
jgi:hypothetical protein